MPSRCLAGKQCLCNRSASLWKVGDIHLCDISLLSLWRKEGVRKCQNLNLSLMQHMQQRQDMRFKPLHLLSGGNKCLAGVLSMEKGMQQSRARKNTCRWLGNPLTATDKDPSILGLQKPWPRNEVQLSEVPLLWPFLPAACYESLKTHNDAKENEWHLQSLYYVLGMAPGPLMCIHTQPSLTALPRASHEDWKMKGTSRWLHSHPALGTG